MLNSKQCEAFLAVTETGSFDAAAARLCLTASAVTLRVQSLEKSLGQLLIVRERPCKPTQAGLALMQYLQHSRLLEQQFMQDIQGSGNHGFYQLKIAVNDDSLATWLMPVIQQMLIEQQISLHIQIDDQSQTHHLLEAGLVNACISAEPEAMKGCLAVPIGVMRYRMTAAPAFAEQWFAHGISRDALRQAPAVIYNTKDRIHSDLILKAYGLPLESYPHHFIPSSQIFAEAIFNGLGFGMVPEYQIAGRIESGELIELMPEMRVHIPLYWHHWKQQSAQLHHLTSILTSSAAQAMNGNFQSA